MMIGGALFVHRRNAPSLPKIAQPRPAARKPRGSDPASCRFH
jgi:hypothetical protein